jgi:hypothetical protein
VGAKVPGALGTGVVFWVAAVAAATVVEGVTAVAAVAGVAAVLAGAGLIVWGAGMRVEGVTGFAGVAAAISAPFLQVPPV